MNPKNIRNQHFVKITNASTGETRISKPVVRHVSRDSVIPTSLVEQSPSESAQDAIDENIVIVETQPMDLSPEKEKVAEKSNIRKNSDEIIKSKSDIDSFEKLIEYAYSRKGKSIALKAREEKKIVQDLLLSNPIDAKLLAILADDKLLAVPRQILLLSNKINSSTILQTALNKFVSTIILKHPVFNDAVIHSVLHNLPDADTPANALLKIIKLSQPDPSEIELLKSTENKILRRNAVNLFVTWLAITRSINIDELISLMLQTIWQPAACELKDDNDKLRALTEIIEPAGVGLACISLRQQVIEAQNAKHLALREVSSLRLRLTETDKLRSQAEEKCYALQAELEMLRTTSTAEVAEIRMLNEVECTQLRHDQEQLRGRMVHRLDKGIEMLEVGLTALQNKMPRVEVMLERAEDVLEILHTEVKNLKGK